MSKKKFNKGNRREKEVKEFDEEVLEIARVTRVVKGGRRLRFRALVAIGDRKGRVGIGIGKATEVVSGIKKAVANAKKSLIKVPLTDTETIPHEVKMKYKAARLHIMPAAPGTGVIAGGSLRKILSLAGVKNVLSKNHGTNNKVASAQASIKALQSLKPARNPKKATKEESNAKVETDKKEESASAPTFAKPSFAKATEVSAKADKSTESKTDKKEKSIGSAQDEKNKKTTKKATAKKTAKK